MLILFGLDQPQIQPPVMNDGTQRFRNMMMKAYPSGPRHHDMLLKAFPAVHAMEDFAKSVQEGPTKMAGDHQVELAELKADLMEAVLEDPNDPNVDVLIHRISALLKR